MICEFRTQLASGGQYRTIYESFDAGGAFSAAVLTSLTALPVDLPAFLIQGAPAQSKGDAAFTYTSRASATGVKDPER